MSYPLITDAILASLADDEEITACFPVAWTAVAEVVDQDGKRWLMRFNSGSDEDPLPEWIEDGMLFRALYHPEVFTTEEDE